MIKNITPFCFLFLMLLSGCGNNVVLDQSTATDLISDYLRSNPEYETETLTLGEIKFKSKNDKFQLEKFKELRDKDYVDMKLLDQNKRFLSKDSSYVYLIKFTDKSKPFILKQERNLATVKVLEYDMEESKSVTLNKSSNKKATVTVMLRKVKNAFTIFYDDKNTGGNFITKTYKLKYEKEQGWIVTGE